MPEARPVLSNLMVCLTISLHDQYPALFEAVGRPEAEDGGSVFVYDALAAITGRDFDACWEALERASDAGLIDPSGTFHNAFLTAQGWELVDKSHRDVVDLCRRHAAHLDEEDREQLLALIEATPRVQIAPVPTVAVPLDPAVELDEVDEDIDPDDDPIEDVEPAPPRRLRP